MDPFIISKDADTRAQGAALAVGGYKREAYWWFAAAELFPATDAMRAWRPLAPYRGAVSRTT